MSKNLSIAGIALMIAILGSLILGGLGMIDATWTTILVIAGIIVGATVKKDEAKTYLLYAIALTIIPIGINLGLGISGFLEGAVGGLAVTMAVVAITIIVKSVLTKVKVL